MPRRLARRDGRRRQGRRRALRRARPARAAAAARPRPRVAGPDPRRFLLQAAGEERGGHGRGGAGGAAGRQRGAHRVHQRLETGVGQDRGQVRGDHARRRCHARDVERRWSSIGAEPSPFLQYPFSEDGLANYADLGVTSQAIDRLPVVPGLMEAVGIGYSGWFAYRNLLFKPDRDAFFAKVRDVYEDIISG